MTNGLLMIKIVVSLLIIIIVDLAPAYSQKQDFEWILNYNFLKFKRELGSGCTKISFNTESGNPNIYFDSINITEFYRSASCIADQSTGEFLFAFNGYHAEDATGERIINWKEIIDDCEPVPQGHLILPIPGKPDEYILFTSDIHYIGGQNVVGITQLSRSLLKCLDGKRFEVISGKTTVIEDTLDYGKITACKHANGRDWWVIVPVININHFYKILVTPSGISNISIQEVNNIFRSSDLGSASFSNNGAYYAIATHMPFNYLDGIGNYIHFYQFDRCYGSLYNHQYMYVDTIELFGVGVEFSPDSKLLYLASGSNLYQYEIINDSLKNKKRVAIYDGYYSEYLPGIFTHNKFQQIQSAPDGRIYMCARNAPTNVFHSINKPNNLAWKCDFRQHNVSIPTLKTVMPHFPKFRLGPIDNSVCDTLNIDNVPWAYWRYDQDSSSYLRFEFTDLSAYEVEEWHWDFGDPSSPLNSSNEQNPYHLFSSNGTYKVCLIAKNNNGVDTFCRTIQIGTVSTNDQIKESIRVNLFPNPCNDYFLVDVQDYNPELMKIKLYDPFGKKIFTQRLFMGNNSIDMNGINPGIFHYTLSEKGINVKSGYIIKLDN